MKVRTKLRLGFGFLFLVVLFFGATALFYIRDISENSKVILKNNYESLSFAREMRTILDNNDLPLTPDAANKFNQYLLQQEHNITEPGEKKFTGELRANFEQLKASAAMPVQLHADRTLRHTLSKIEHLNMLAIVRKDNNARASVKKATLFLGLVGTFTFLVLFSFSVNFPGFIANPLRALLEGIREIGKGNYSKRLHFEQNDEFAEVANAFNLMAARLNEWENSNLATVVSEKRRIETIIEQMQDAIIGINEKQEVLFMNDAARKTLNITDDKVIGQNAGNLVKSNDLLKSILKDDAGIKPFKIVLDGRELYFQMQSNDIVVPNLSETRGALQLANRSAGKVYILKNITEFKERDEAKTNFIATISHELKTPIASIKMSLKLLNDQRVGTINAEQEQLINHINDDNDRLLKITSELLELSQVETGNIQLNFVPVNPMQIVDYAITSIKFQAEQKHVKLEILKADKLPDVQVDIEKTAWVLVNFLSNALRYSAEKSKIEIRVSALNQQVEFAVKDFGKGIDETYQKRLFDRYFQVPTDGQNKSGSGLGLAISKDFINAQGGTIGVESEIGAGSRFWFSLPIANIQQTA
ncbi:HAMP domain-containing sensor histidine kinase [Mucilaginibacter phyllosphaerae]|uniref:histidine kinase n=1 Tax=Mucilaginibacter phyllosphaerae TaxID=1812349 RepID=A0A4Y8AB41_9SPHI|nr:ATP-binding protein [Mucilaginibacter phyllosphaerae]MBB3969413.1 signal transduction histidine kinase/PAS domain-containing protein [Mucilaginibacter phyllosphaerae]TEW65801.1 HAMP domain-containing protein [Mucilaginibacter phyllosphaerae]GGH08349.1 PAS domain-containing sensor histidine kinase [Mucilaginibacter phyllosphaerae]